jgi:hypothetical protein
MVLKNRLGQFVSKRDRLVEEETSLIASLLAS